MFLKPSSKLKVVFELQQVKDKILAFDTFLEVSDNSLNAFSSVYICQEAIISVHEVFWELVWSKD